MDNISNNSKVTVGIINYLVDIVKSIAVLLYFSFIFWASFGFFTIFFNEFAATLLAVLMVYISYDNVIKPKLVFLSRNPH